MALSSFTPEVRDSLSNLAASLNAGKDKAAQDAFVLFGLDRAQVEAMYRGDWLARKIVDIVPYDMVREWREWAGERPAVAAAEAAERRLNLRKVVQRALTLGRLYGGSAIIVGTNEGRPEALAAPLDPESIGPGDIKFLHVVSRWQLGSPLVNRDPLDPWFGEPLFYEIVAPERGALQLHPSRVLRFLGNEFPDPTLGLSAWSDSVLQTLYDAIHAVALTTTGATSLMHEAKVDVVTVPNLSEHLSSAATTAQLSARFSYAAAMKSINNLLLLGDGETWNRQRIDFSGLPQMVQTFLQVAAGAADIPVTRLLGQSPAGMSATGDSDTRNYYDMISSRQEIDLRPQLERLDRLMLRSAGLDPASLTFEFRPLWQLDAAEKASVALSKAQASAVYAGLNLWPTDVTAQLVQAQLVEDGIYPNAETIFAEAKATTPRGGEGTNSPGPFTPEPGRPSSTVTDLGFNPDQPRDPDGRWSGGSAAPSGTPFAPVSAAVPVFRPPTPSSGFAGGLFKILSQVNPIGTAQAQEIDREEENRRGSEETNDPTAELRIQRYADARETLKAIDPNNPNLNVLTSPNYVPSEDDIRDLNIEIERLKLAEPSSNPSLPGTMPPETASTISLGPPGLIVSVTGRTLQERAASYEQQIRTTFGSGASTAASIPGVGRPDDRMGDSLIEIKYTENFSCSIYNPRSLLRFPHNAIDAMVDQAKRYNDSSKGSLTIYVNDLGFAEFYSDLLVLKGIGGARFVVVPSKQ